MPSQFYILPFNPHQLYKQFDVVYGISGGGVTNPSPYFYATQDLATGNSPSGSFNFSVTQYSRTDDVTVIRFTQTGNVPSFQPGSIIQVAGVAANTTVNYTGMVIGGASGWASYINPGNPLTASVGAGTVSCMNPGWTTGFLFVGGYSSKMESENKTFVAKMGDLYEQRMAAGINSYEKNIDLIFDSRSDRETKAMINYVQDAGGVRCFPILFPVSLLENQPNQKYVAGKIGYVPDSWGLNTVSISVRRVFDL